MNIAILEWTGSLHQIKLMPASVARMRRPTEEQEIAGSTPPRSATFFRGD